MGVPAQRRACGIGVDIGVDSDILSAFIGSCDHKYRVHKHAPIHDNVPIDDDNRHITGIANAEHNSAHDNVCNIYNADNVHNADNVDNIDHRDDGGRFDTVANTGGRWLTCAANSAWAPVAGVAELARIAECSW